MGPEQLWTSTQTMILTLAQTNHFSAGQRCEEQVGAGLPAILSHRRSTTVSLENYPFNVVKTLGRRFGL